MTTIRDINDQRDAAIAILTDRMLAADEARERGAAGMVAVTIALAQQRAALAAQAYKGALSNPAMTDALAKLTAVTDEMNKAARKMRSATTIIANIDALITTANKVLPVLKGRQRRGRST